MKTRLGFVSNSSSSSFMIFKKRLTYSQEKSILENKPPNCPDQYLWNIYEEAGKIIGEVSLDNFSMSDYLESLNIKDKHIYWDSYPHWDSYSAEEDDADETPENSSLVQEIICPHCNKRINLR